MQRPPGVRHGHHVGFGWPQWPTKRASSASFGFGCLGAGHTTATRHASGASFGHWLARRSASCRRASFASFPSRASKSMIWPWLATEWPTRPSAHHHQHRLGSGLASEPGMRHATADEARIMSIMWPWPATEWPTRPTSSASFGLAGPQSGQISIICAGNRPTMRTKHHLALAGHRMAHQARIIISIIWALAWPRSRAIHMAGPPGLHHQHHLGSSRACNGHQVRIMSII